MKKIMLKELRVGFKIALLGMGIFTVVLIHAYKTSGGRLASVVSGLGFLRNEDMQPLLSSQFHNETICFCALFGIVLGWMQIRAEKHPDLWAFLIHRPVTRMSVLRGKVVAGLILYAFGAGLPLLAFIAYVRAPGHVAAPFEWLMTLPSAAIFLLGIVYYFAGMLTALRRARWFGSRGFGLGLAFFATMGLPVAEEFWQALLILLATGSILAVAVRGSFQSGGYYRGQTLPGKLALTVASVAATILIIVVSVTGFYEALLAPESGNWSYVGYEMTKDGVVYKVTRHINEEPEIADLNGKPLLDEKTGRPIKAKVFDQWRAPEFGVFARFGGREEWRNMGQPGYANPARFFNAWHLADKTFWYWSHNGRVLGYDGITRRHVATFDAPENSVTKAGTAPGFISPRNRGYFNGYDSDLQRVLVSSTAVYLVNFTNRALTPIFTVAAGESIGGYVDSIGYSQQEVAVASEKSIHLLNLDGQVEWSVPYQPSYPDYDLINVIFLEATNRLALRKFAVEFQPNQEANKKSGWKLPTRFEWITARQGISKTLDLPKLPDVKKDNLGDELTGLLMPFPISVTMTYLDDSARLWGWLSLIPAISCILVGWWLGRRHTFSTRAQVGWAVFHLFLGLPGLLAFLSVQEWPAREPCLHCKKLRVVDREKCPYCGADFGAPEKNGTEIFEALTPNLRD